MVTLADLWLPILLSAIGVFFASSISHMCLPFHKSDFRPLKDEEGLLDALRPQGLPPGEYFFPFASSMKEATSPEMIEKQNRGPCGSITVWPNGPVSMGKALLQWFSLSLFISFVTGYVGTMALAKGAEGSSVFQLTGTVSLLVYASLNIPNSIWKNVPWSTTLKFVIDGVVYGLATGAIFMALWPAIA